MIEILPESDGNVLGVRASEKLTDEDYKSVWIPRLEETIRVHGKVRALLYLDEGFEGWEAHALWDDAKFGLQHRKDFEKLAVVGGPKWSGWAISIGGHLLTGEVKVFSGDQLRVAWDWVRS
jgi:SpoIIAA-like